MQASARTPRRGRRNDSSSIGGHSHKDASLLSASTTCTSSERATTSAVAFEAFQYLFFSEMESAIDLNDLSQGIVTYNATELIVHRVQRRLLDKYIKAGRLVTAFFCHRCCRFDPRPSTRWRQSSAFRSTSSFSKNPIEIGSDIPTMPIERAMARDQIKRSLSSSKLRVRRGYCCRPCSSQEMNKVNSF